ncbi:MAG: 30S ribosomal protein S2 [Candidatus Spechtbacterales bacterium]|nr:30S ribosomal protein S2 [Candidatus Spechtbacterales bacterium]
MTKTKEETSEKEAKTKEQNIPEELREFIEAGVQFGHLKSHVHPGMFPYIFGVRNNAHVIDVTKTKEKLNEALESLAKLAQEGKTILFVGTKVPVRSAVQKTAEDTGMPYIVNRWFGGTLTNWETIKERLEHLQALKDKTKSEEWSKYPKHERMDMEKEIKKLEHFFGGISSMEKLPDAIFIVDIHEDEIAAKEAKKTGIKSFAITDTNVNPAMVDHPIPANDDAVSSVELILAWVAEEFKKSKKVKTSTSKKNTSAKKKSAKKKTKKTANKKKSK